MEIIYWDEKAQEQRSRPMTASEIEQWQTEIEALLAAVPQRIPRKYGRLALAQAGLLAGVPAVIAAMPEPDRTYAQLAWEDEEEWVRGNAFVTGLGAGLGLTEAQIDDLFRAAHALSQQ